MTMKALQAIFKFEKETKGAVRYQEVDDQEQLIDQSNALVGTLYLRKDALSRNGFNMYPKEFQLIINAEQDDG